MIGPTEHEQEYGCNMMNKHLPEILNIKRSENTNVKETKFTEKKLPLVPSPKGLSQNYYEALSRLK